MGKSHGRTSDTVGTLLCSVISRGLGGGWQPLSFSPLWRELPHRGADAAIIGTGGLHLVPSHGTCLGDLADRVVGTVESPGLPYMKELEVRAVLRRRSKKFVRAAAAVALKRTRALPPRPP